MLPAVKPSFDRWFFSPSLQTTALLQLANFYTLQFSMFFLGGDQPRPDDPHPFFAWGTSGASRRWSQLRLFQRGNGG